ncbi:MAG: hypothetical protein QM784_25395 [Polyangiaceae bacterium]
MTTPPKTQSGTKGPGALGWFGRIRVRLLVVNLLLVLVPIVGLEFARLYERQLLVSLERDMRNQAALLTQVLLMDLDRGVTLGDESHERALEYAARSTRTRLRVVDASFSVVADSHRHGPPEGREPQPPSLVRYRDSSLAALGVSLVEGPEIPLRERDELKRALRGTRATVTRLREKSPCGPDVSR